MKRLLLPLALIVLLTGCAQVPKPVPRPWNRTLSQDVISPGASMSVKVQSEGSVFLGSEQMTEQQIADMATSLLERRGFIITNDNPQFALEIKIKTELRTRETTEFKSSNRSGVITARYYGLGVFLAQLMQASMAWTQSTTSISKNEYDFYRHSFGIQILDRNKQIIWKNDTYFETLDIDILNIHLQAYPQKSEIRCA